MTDKSGLKKDQDKEEVNRRRLIKSLVAGGTAAAAIPNKWTSPIVESVVMPAHAMTSEVSPDVPPDSCGAPGTGSSNTAGLSANVTAAVIGGGGELIVVGEADVPDTCWIGVGADDDNRGLTCELVDCNATVLFSEDTDTFGHIGPGGGCSAPGQVCMVSCSVEVDPGSHAVTSGDAVTLRFRFLGGCLVSAVGTVG